VGRDFTHGVASGDTEKGRGENASCRAKFCAVATGDTDRGDTGWRHRSGGVVSALGRGLLDALDEADLAALAERVAPFLPPSGPPVDDGWLSTRQAADYAGCSIHALRHAAAAREVRFAQRSAGAKAWFRKVDLDAWRRGEDPHDDHRSA